MPHKPSSLNTTSSNPLLFASQLNTSLSKLEAWIQLNEYSGWDPFDALNSPMLQKLANHNHILQVLFIQILKHLPINLRNILKIPSKKNAKGIALFLSAYLKQEKVNKTQSAEKNIDDLYNWLLQNQTKQTIHASWGYPFPWANRSFFVEENHPNAITTSFVGLSLLNHYQLYKDETALHQARSACNFMLNDLNQSGSLEEGICFSYTPYDHRYLHNVNMLVASLLAETGILTNENKLMNTALAILKYTIRHQKPNGSWTYGESSRDQFIDNFHTGFILVTLQKLSLNFPSTEIKLALKNGYNYWKDNFLLPDGIVRYYAKSTYPIDIHAVAQSILTLLAFHKDDPQASELACKIANWAITHMQSKQGYFYYQKTLFGINRIPYMRWSQAWMYLALTELSIHLKSNKDANY